MIITTGKVNGGSIEVEAGTLPEGASVTILAPEDGELFELDNDNEARLLAAIDEAERGDVINAKKVLEQIRRS